MNFKTASLFDLYEKVSLIKTQKKLNKLKVKEF